MERFVARRLSHHVSLTLAAFALAGHCRAAMREVAVVDENGRPVPRVAVYATADGQPATSVGPTAVMDQHNDRFEPHILVVQKGTSVSFPNHDDVSHHV